MNDELTAHQRHQSPYRRPLRQAHLLHSGPRRDLVPQVVAPLSGGRTRGPLRPDASQPPCRPAHPARTGEGHSLHPPPAPGPYHAGHPLLPDRGHGHPCRIEGPGHPSAPLRADHRACPAAQRIDRPGSTWPRCCHARSTPARKPGPPTNSIRLIWWDRFTSRAAATATTSGWARMPSTAPFACAGLLSPHGRGPLVPRGVLEGSGNSRAGPVGQRPRIVRLGAGGADPVAGDPALPAVRRRAGASSRPGSRSSTAAWRTSTAGSSRGCSTGATPGQATCVGSWHGCRRRSTRSMSIRGSGARRRRSTAGACGCGNCPRASWYRRGGCRWRRARDLHPAQ